MLRNAGFTLEMHTLRTFTLRYRRGSALCLSVPAVPLPSPGPAPGPGSYNLIGSFDNVSRRSDVASSTFLSKTCRWTTANTTRSNMPGPGSAVSACRTALPLSVIMLSVIVVDHYIVHIGLKLS